MKAIQRFERKKEKLIDVLHQIDHFIASRSQEDSNTTIPQMIEDLNREKFEVIVVGEFSNGKSTFINALLRSDVLPSSSVPTTALLNKIVYSKNESYTVHYDNGKREKVSKQQFETYVSEDKKRLTAGRFTHIKQAAKETLTLKKSTPTYLEIGYPAELCKNNIVIIDSPGTNDMDEERVRITNEYIPKSDAAIFVLNATQIFTQSEKNFLHRIADADIQRIFFIINYKDQVQTEEDLVAIEEEVLKHLAPFDMNPKVHFVSALHAFYHYVPLKESSTMNIREKRRLRKLQEDKLPLSETGLPQLEEALFTFLSEDQGREKLRKPIKRTKRLLQRVKQEHILFDIETLNRSIENIDEHIQKILQQLDRTEKNIQREAKKLRRTIEEESKDIIIWYKKEVAHISQLAKQEMDKGLTTQESPEAIKRNIDSTTGALETTLYVEFEDKVNQMIQQVLINSNEQLRQDLDVFKQDIVGQKIVKPEWEGYIEEPIVTETERSDATLLGAAIGAGAVLLSGGAVGWGLLGAAGGAAVANTYVSANSSKDAEAALKKQVNLRYGKGFKTQAKKMEELLKQLATETKEFYEVQAEAEVQNEREKARRLLNNQRLSEKQQQDTLTQLRMELDKCDSYTQQLTHILNTY